MERFTIAVEDAVLDALRARLATTRFTSPSGEQPWQGGVDPAWLQDLVRRWAGDYDWRAVESALNAFDHRTADVHGTRLHFVRVQVGAEPRTPLLLAHGWPSSFLEMLPLAEALAGALGEGPGGYDLVIPSMPGFLFSELPAGPLTRQSMARLLHALMTEVLGFERYGVLGGDVGGTVAAWMAAEQPAHVIGLYMIHPPFPAEFAEPVTADEQAFIDREDAYDATDGGYSAIMITRPDTVAAALVDSPAGLLAWIADKLRDWSDCGGDLFTRFAPDDVLTLATLYWVTGSIGTSFRQYFDYGSNPPRPMTDVPAGFTLSAEPVIAGMPRSIAERACSDIRVWRQAEQGGHFLAFEEPALLAAHLHEFFEPLR